MSHQSLQFPKSWQQPDTPGFGTYPGPHGYRRMNEYTSAMCDVLQIGYRHIDTAHAYENEERIGEALTSSGVPRSELFLTSKQHPNRTDFAATRDGILESLRKLRIEYIDSYLVHYPGRGNPPDAWRAILEARNQGTCIHAGVSNFEINHLEKLISLTEKPEVNQIEFHPLLYSNALEDLVQFCQQKEIAVEGYCPLAWGSSELLESDAVKSAAKDHQESSARVVLRWCMQHGVRPIFGSLNPTRMREYLQPYNFQLNSAQMTAINLLGVRKLRISQNWGWNPPAVACTHWK